MREHLRRLITSARYRTARGNAARLFPEESRDLLRPLAGDAIRMAGIAESLHRTQAAGLLRQCGAASPGPRGPAGSERDSHQERLQR